MNNINPNPTPELEPAGYKSLALFFAGYAFALLVFFALAAFVIDWLW